MDISLHFCSLIFNFVLPCVGMDGGKERCEFIVISKSSFYPVISIHMPSQKGNLRNILLCVFLLLMINVTLLRFATNEERVEDKAY